MTETDRLVRLLQLLAVIALCPVLVMSWGHLAFGWFKDGTPGESFYYALTMSLQVFFILVQVWIIRLRSRAS